MPPFLVVSPFFIAESDDFVKRISRQRVAPNDTNDTIQLNFPLTDENYEYFEYFANEILKPGLPARFVTDN